jgi:hypothetical protein
MSAFEPISVVHLVRPTGARAHNLEELRVGIADASAECLFYHAHQYVLRFHDADELPPNDLAAWVEGVVQDRETAERLAFASASEGSNLAALRSALLAVLESVPERQRVQRDAPEEGDFRFHAAHSVRVPSGAAVASVEELVEFLREAEPACLFFHLYERPLLFPDEPAPLERWVEEQGERRFAELLREAPEWGLPLEDVRRQLVQRWRRSRIRRRLAARTREPDAARQKAAQRAVARWVNRMRGTGPEEAE